MRHVDVHPFFVPDCFPCKVLSISVTVRPSAQASMEGRWDRDMPAYSRLRMNGLQPPRIDGCAELEGRASTQQEVEMGRIFARAEMPKVAEGMELAREMREFAFDQGISTIVKPKES